MTNDDVFMDRQLAKAIYLRMMSAMKEILNLGQFKIGNRQSEEYKYFKKVVMDQFYNSMSDVFEALAHDELLTRCECGTSIRQGYKSCDKCNGSGYRNSDDFADMMDELAPWPIESEDSETDQQSS